MPLCPHLEQELAERLECVRWFELDDVSRDALLASRAAEVRFVTTGGHVGCPAELMLALPGLELIAINGVGFDKVDLQLAGQRGVAVSNTPDVLTEDVADLAVGLVIAARRGIAAGDALVRNGLWPQGELRLGRKVSGSRFGILGMGRIGSAIADRLAPFGPVSYCSRSVKPGYGQHFAELIDLAEWCDVLIVACAATHETAGMVNQRVMQALGHQGWLVNVARGSIVDEAAVIAALENGTIAGAALDVFADEPNVPEALRTNPNTVLTPHIGSASVETRLEMARLVMANIDAVLAGRPPLTPVA